MASDQPSARTPNGGTVELNDESLIQGIRGSLEALKTSEDAGGGTRTRTPARGTRF